MFWLLFCYCFVVVLLLFCYCFVVVVVAAVVIVVVRLLLLVVVFGGGIVVVFLILVINYFFSYSNFLYKIGGFKVSTKWVFMGYFVMKLRYKKVEGPL